MVKASTASLLVVAVLSLGGCQTVFDAVGVAQPLSASAAHRYDGSYQGDVDLVSATGTGSPCPVSEGEKVIMVGDGVLWYAYSPSITFSLPVEYNGEVSGTTDDTVLKGKFEGNTVKLTIKSPTCLTQMSMRYIYNHS